MLGFVLKLLSIKRLQQELKSDEAFSKFEKRVSPQYVELSWLSKHIFSKKYLFFIAPEGSSSNNETLKGHKAYPCELTRIIPILVATGIKI